MVRLLTFDERGNVVPLSADGTKVESNLKARQGDQVRWITPHGSAIIEFQGSAPFDSGTAKRNEDFRALSVSEGSYPYRCSLVLDWVRNAVPWQRERFNRAAKE